MYGWVLVEYVYKDVQVIMCGIIKKKLTSGRTKDLIIADRRLII